MTDGDPGGTRTHNHQNRNLAFYPIELRDHEGMRVSVGVGVGANLEKISFSHSVFFCLSFILLYVIY